MSYNKENRKEIDMEKNKKNIWIIIGIVIILAFIALLFILKKENKTEVKNENEAKT